MAFNMEWFRKQEALKKEKENAKLKEEGKVNDVIAPEVTIKTSSTRRLWLL